MVNIDDSAVSFLGQCEIKPVPTRTRREAAAIDKLEVVGDDVNRTQRQLKAAKRAVKKKARAMSEFDAWLDAKKKQKANVNERRRELASKWRPYIQQDLRCDKAASYLKRASHLLDKANIELRGSKLPPSHLVSASELSYLIASESTAASEREEGTISEAASLRLLAAASKVSSSFGKILRSGFEGHTDLKHELHQLQSRDPAYRCNPANEKKTAVSTRILKPVQDMVVNMAAPVYALEGGGEGVQRRAFTDREEKSHCMMANSMRYLSNPQNNYPVFDSVGADVANALPKSQQNRISEHWGVMTTHQTGTSFKDRIAEQHENYVQSHFMKLREDPDVHGARGASDNVGHGSKLRFETSTHHMFPLLYSSLPESVRESALAPESQSWASMAESGLDSPNHLLASQRSDELMRLIQIYAVDY